MVLSFPDKTSMYLLCSILSLTTAVSCMAVSSDASYHGVSLNFKSNMVRVTPSKSIRTRSPDNHSHICDIYVGDCKTDQVMSLDGKLVEWHEFKNIGRAMVGDLVAHQQYSVKYPTRYPWIDFNTCQTLTDGEKPTIVSAKTLVKQPLECTYLVYIFRSGDVVQAAYDPKGVIGRCGLLQPDGIDSIFFGAKEVARPIFTGPGVPVDRVEILREAFNMLHDDAQFRQDAAQAHLEVDPRPAAEVNAYVKLVAGASPEVAQRLMDILNPYAK